MLFGKVLGKPDITLESIVAGKRICFSFLPFLSNGVSFPEKNKKILLDLTVIVSLTKCLFQFCFLIYYIIPQQLQKQGILMDSEFDL